MGDELADDQIRLVSILDVGSDSTPFHVSRSHRYRLPLNEDIADTGKDASGYIALSYVWGTVAGRIKCDDIDLDVSVNLISALRQLHHHYSDRYFWTDSISIDQQDAGEKAHQVSMMGEIYAGATTVVVWLGDDSDDIYHDLVDPQLLVPESQAASEARVVLLRRLAQHPWFYRCWTFQEIRLARHAIVAMGPRLMEWRDFIGKIHLIRNLEPNLSTVTIYSEQRSYSKFAFEPKDQFFTILDELNAGTSVDLAALLFATWYRAASIRHDKVYSLLSSALFKNEGHGIEIDYDLSWSTLCIKAARACMNTASNLKILKIAGMKQRRKALYSWDSGELSELLGHPSWAPNWWEPPQRLRASESFIYDERGCFSPLNFCCPTTTPPQALDNASPFLVLKGVVLGILNVDCPPTNEHGFTLVHAPPHCAAGQPHQWLSNPQYDQTASSLEGVLKVYMPEFINDIQRHQNQQCFCFPGGGFGALSPQPHSGYEKPQLQFDLTHFALNYCPLEAAEGGSSQRGDSVPAQVLATSVESGDFLVLLEGGGMPFVLRPVISRVGGAERPEALMTREEQQKVKVPDDAGCFVLVGEASMCWNQLWPHMWDTYCRAGTFFII